MLDLIAEALPPGLAADRLCDRLRAQIGHVRPARRCAWTSARTRAASPSRSARSWPGSASSADVRGARRRRSRTALLAAPARRTSRPSRRTSRWRPRHSTRRAPRRGGCSGCWPGRESVYGREPLGPLRDLDDPRPADVLAVLAAGPLGRRRRRACRSCRSSRRSRISTRRRACWPSSSRSTAYRAHLDAGGGEQMVMIGYSDSNKDGGYLAANWALYRAQEPIARACREHGVALTLFHGRGGTRGARRRPGGPRHPRPAAGHGAAAASASPSRARRSRRATPSPSWRTGISSRS